MIRAIRTKQDVEEGLVALCKLDPRLAPALQEIREAGHDVPVRSVEPSLPSLLRIVVGQQVSVASADAIWARFSSGMNLNDSAALAEASDDALGTLGLSRPKQKTVRAIAAAHACGELDFEELQQCATHEVSEKLVALHGVGPWTAEIFLLLCIAHPDIFPVGDIALQHAAKDILGLDERPVGEELALIAEKWSPWRAIAARLLWAHYGMRRKRKDVIPA